MTLEKTIEELDKIRNAEYERLRYDRSIWAKKYPDRPSLIESLAVSLSRSKQEVFEIHNELTFKKLTHEWQDEIKINASGEELKPLIETFQKEYPLHEEAVKLKQQSIVEQIEAMKKEFQNLYKNYEPEILNTVLELANMQRNERYLFESKGIPTDEYEYEFNGIKKYGEDYEPFKNTGLRVLSGREANDYFELYNSPRELRKEVISALIEGEE